MGAASRVEDVVLVAFDGTGASLLHTSGTVLNDLALWCDFGSGSDPLVQKSRFLTQFPVFLYILWANHDSPNKFLSCSDQPESISVTCDQSDSQFKW